MADTDGLARSAAAGGSSNSSAIEIRGLGKTFSGGVRALEGIDLDVAEGEFLAIVGPSGCGKSTLLRMIAGLENATQGELSVLGVAPAVARMQRKIGMVFQDPALFPWRSVRDNVRLPGELFKDAAIAARAEDWIKRVGLSGFEDALPRTLSGGMRSRVAIARALVFRPPLLMMDEPFGALDERTRDDMHRELLGLWEEVRPTVVFVTHSVGEALFLADRVLVMSARPGRIVDVIAAPFPRPRARKLRHSAEFGALAERVLDLLG